MSKNCEKLLDISHLTCPMTTVHVRLKIDNMHSGETLKIILEGEEPRKNVLLAIKNLGHDVQEYPNTSGNTKQYQLRVIKS